MIYTNKDEVIHTESRHKSERNGYLMHNHRSDKSNHIESVLNYILYLIINVSVLFCIGLQTVYPESYAILTQSEDRL